MRVGYEVEGWGRGELWFDGRRLVWHELPRPRGLDEAALAKGRTQRVAAERHPRPGGEASRRPRRSTLSPNHAHVSNESAPHVRQLVHKLRRYFDGEPVAFLDVELDLDGYTKFQLALTRALRRVRYGDAISYAELARSAGYPNAQRAAGTFCAKNRYPLVVPCHRVLATNGLGSYGSLGVEYKQRLLELEGFSRAV